MSLSLPLVSVAAAASGAIYLALFLSGALSLSSIIVSHLLSVSHSIPPANTLFARRDSDNLCCNPTGTEILIHRTFYYFPNSGASWLILG